MLEEVGAIHLIDAVGVIVDIEAIVEIEVIVGNNSELRIEIEVILGEVTVRVLILLVTVSNCIDN